MNEPATLDPPGAILVIGAGPLGLEAALYGRYLGYEVTVVEAEEVGHSLTSQRDQPLPLLPDRCLSPLAISALAAQHHQSGPRTLPTTVGQWIDEGLLAIAQTDLMRGRVITHSKVTQIDLVPVQPDPSEAEDAEPNDAEPVPDDFRLQIQRTSDAASSSTETPTGEAVIVAIGTIATSWTPPPAGTEYYFRVGAESVGEVESDLKAGYRQIVEIFAGLAGRETLDLYRPKRL